MGFSPYLSRVEDPICKDRGHSIHIYHKKWFGFAIPHGRTNSSTVRHSIKQLLFVFQNGLSSPIAWILLKRVLISRWSTFIKWGSLSSTKRQFLSTFVWKQSFEWGATSIIEGYHWVPDPFHPLRRSCGKASYSYIWDLGSIFREWATTLQLSSPR